MALQFNSVMQKLYGNWPLYYKPTSLYIYDISNQRTLQMLTNLNKILIFPVKRQPQFTRTEIFKAIKPFSAGNAMCGSIK